MKNIRNELKTRLINGAIEFQNIEDATKYLCKKHSASSPQEIKREIEDESNADALVFFDGTVLIYE